MKEREEAKTNMKSLIALDFERTLLVDADCETFIKDMLGTFVLEHYHSMTFPAH